MKWLLHNWAGRLYLVIQIACLAITITRCLSFISADRDAEWADLRDNQSLVHNFAEGEEAQHRLLLSWGETTLKKHSEQRRNAILLCVAINLAVPAIFGVGYFIVKGLPKRKSEN
jgi:hypothetical protein